MKFKKFGKALLFSALAAGVVFSVSSCTQSYSVGYLYVTGTSTAAPKGNGIISGFKIDHNTGKLTTIVGLPVSSGGANPVRALLMNGSRFLYVLNRGVNAEGNGDCTTADPCLHPNITQFSVGGNGVLAQQPIQITPYGRNPIRLIADPSGSGNYVFVLDHDAPSSQACQLALGSGVTSCAAIEVYSIDATTGRLQVVLNAQVSSSSGQALPYFPVPSNPIDFVMAGSYIMTLYGTPSTGDFAFPYAYNGANGQLTISQNSSQPLNIYHGTAIDYQGGKIYILANDALNYTDPNGEPQTVPSQIVPYTVGTNGALQAQTGGAKPDDPSLANPVVLLQATGSKSWIYVANAGLNDTGTGLTQDGIAMYVLDSATGELKLPSNPYGAGSGPVCLVEDPSNQFLYTANSVDSTVTGRTLDQNTGELKELKKGSTFQINGPATWCLVDGRTN